MKGTIQLVAQIDYDEMLVNENLEGIYAFTGAKSKEEVVQLHLKQLGEKLNGVIDSLPHVVFQIEGNLTKDEEVASEDEVDVVVEDKLEEAKLDYSFEEVLMESNIEMLNDVLLDISVDRGIPKRIVVNDYMYDSIVYKVKQITKKDSIGDGEILRYQGFELVKEGMEELFWVDYQDYVTAEIKTASASDTVLSEV